jgi:hypothetical protein
MNDNISDRDQTDEEILTYKVSDEALENAAGTGREKAGSWTFGACAGLDCGSNG